MRCPARMTFHSNTYLTLTLTRRILSRWRILKWAKRRPRTTEIYQKMKTGIRATEKATEVLRMIPRRNFGSVQQLYRLKLHMEGSSSYFIRRETRAKDTKIQSLICFFRADLKE